ncbi:MAG: tRNA pseudouridine(38-40) synthase TruA [Candidatus Promineifilaceae bacterium]|nr:tRNA pseudouridine(38-40) synthase TruA [Candidatus Promineifilaceae bacterium]
MARYRALVEYDGTGFYGFQRQRAEFVTVQGVLERALGELVRDPVVVTGAGRTDTGVHATGQVISFTIEWRHGVGALCRALNANLPNTIAVRHVDEVALSFHPRFDARRREYKYYIFNAGVRSPLRRRHSWYVPRPLRVEQLNQASTILVGVHDFATFGLPTQGTVTIREVFNARWQLANEFLVFTVSANAYLYRMVRSLVGSLVNVGLQIWSVKDFEAAFYARDRNRSGPAAPPQGLYLTSITYDD